MPRTIKTFSLDVAVIDALDARCKKTGEKLSRLVEQGLCMVLTLPVPAPAQTDGRGELTLTRSEHAILETLKKMPPGWHSTYELRVESGRTMVVAEKALRDLVRRGDVFLWGACTETGENTFMNGWGLVSPVEFVKKAIADWRAAGGSAKSFHEGPTAVDLVRPLYRQCESIDDMKPIHALLLEATGYSAEGTGLKNKRQIVAELNAVEAAAEKAYREAAKPVPAPAPAQTDAPSDW